MEPESVDQSGKTKLHARIVNRNPVPWPRFKGPTARSINRRREHSYGSAAFHSLGAPTDPGEAPRDAQLAP